jgi:protein-tyrosine phosphatase
VRRRAPSGAPSWPQLQRSRELVWEGCLNVRDLGGHSTEDGGETRYGAVVRADSLHQLTGDGWQSVVDYGIRTVVDLRMDEEREGDPPAGAPVELLHISLFDDDKTVFEEVEAAAEAAPDVAAATREVYLLFLEHFKANVATAIRTVASAPEGGVVVHCMGGKDRTGLVTALLLELAGVADEQIAADYALSEERLRPRHELWFAEAETEAERERLLRIAQTPAASIAGVLAELKRRYGGVEGYLRAAGLSDEDLALARARLRD